MVSDRMFVKGIIFPNSAEHLQKGNDDEVN